METRFYLGTPVTRLTLNRVAALAAAVGLLVLAACDAARVDKLEEGVSTELQVRQQFGEPVTVTVGADGTRTLEYPRQPEGWTNYRIQIGPDGKMSSLRQLLNADNLARVQPGQTQAEVRERLGRPAATQRFALRNEEVWDWRFRPNPNEGKIFSVTFDADGRVRATGTTDDPRAPPAEGR
jgi:outer membrane protein assembly factor BamE (lipoprotein component of BamABCDE complex)